MSNNLEFEIVNMLNEDGWNLVPHQKQGLYVTSFEGENGLYKVYLNTMNLNRQLLVTYGYLPAQVPREKVQKIALLLNKINRRLYFGNFEINYDDGEITFRNGIDFSNEKFTKPMAVNAISPCAFTVDKYFPAIKSVLDTKISPEEALNLVQQQ